MTCLPYARETRLTYHLKSCSRAPCRRPTVSTASFQLLIRFDLPLESTWHARRKLSAFYRVFRILRGKTFPGPAGTIANLQRLQSCTLQNCNDGCRKAPGQESDDRVSLLVIARHALLLKPWQRCLHGLLRPCIKAPGRPLPVETVTRYGPPERELKGKGKMSGMYERMIRTFFPGQVRKQGSYPAEKNKAGRPLLTG